MVVSHQLRPLAYARENLLVLHQHLFVRYTISHALEIRLSLLAIWIFLSHHLRKNLSTQAYNQSMREVRKKVAPVCS